MSLAAAVASLPLSATNRTRPPLGVKVWSVFEATPFTTIFTGAGVPARILPSDPTCTVSCWMCCFPNTIDGPR